MDNNNNPLNGLDLTSLESALGNISEVQSRWSYVVTAEYRLTIQTISILSLLTSLATLFAMLWVWIRHRKYFKRLSLRISAFVALADLLSSTGELVMMNSPLMLAQTGHGLRFVLWLSMFSSLLFVLLTLCMAVQLHLSTLTRVRVRVYMRLERWYVVASFTVAVVLPLVAVMQMQGIVWVPWMHAFSWPTSSVRRRCVLWVCHFAWILVTVVYTFGVSLVLALRIRKMWRNSVDVVAEPRVPEKWDWARLTASARSSEDTMDNLDKESTASSKTLSCGRGYVVTLMANDAVTGRPCAVRSYVDKARFLRSMQRLALYPLVPVLTQLGVVA
ncbi:hypothetical protein IWW50_000944, partial [Coemansia erecta]